MLTFQHPPAIVFNLAVLRQLPEAVAELEPRAEVRAVLDTGQGRTSVAGAEISEFERADTAGLRVLTQADNAVFNRSPHSAKAISPRLTVPAWAAVVEWRWPVISASRWSRRGWASPK